VSYPRYPPSFSALSLRAPMPELGGVGLLAVGEWVIFVPPHLSSMENH
jgi:hypothetical protein